MSASREDDRFLQRCRELTERARRAGNTAVGLVVTLEGRVVAEAEETVPGGPDPFAHAELVAVRRAMARLGRERLRRATLYTTKEPCLLCSFAIREARIGRVVIEAPTAEIGGVTSRYPILPAEDVARWGPPPEIVWISDDAGRRA